MGIAAEEFDNQQISSSSFRVYIDESGDEGFVFYPDGTGSSRWLVLSAVITRRNKDIAMVQLMDRVRGILKRPNRQALHFYKLEHSQKIPYAREIGCTAHIRSVAVLIHKPSIMEAESFQSQKHLLYRYACKLLLERVSWLCRDHRRPGEGNGSAEVIFSNRCQMSYEDLRNYFRTLRDMPGNEIDWTAINPESMSAVEHSRLAGLQVADAVASSFYAAVNRNQYGDVEDRYAKLILPVAYRRKDAVLGHGLKFWPGDLRELKSANPHISWFAEGDQI